MQRYLIGCARLSDHYAATLSPILREGPLTWESFRRLPVMNRAVLATRNQQVRVRKPQAPWLPTTRLSTSGSTGTPIVTEQTRPRAVLQGAIGNRWHVWCGRDFNLDTGFITEPLPKGVADPPRGKRAGTWGGTLGKGASLALTLLASPEQQLRWILDSKISYLVTYPSNLRSLIHESRVLGLRPHALREVMLSSEPIPDRLVEDCHDEWNLRVCGTYSSSELGAIALQDGQGTYRTTDCSVYVEVLSEDGSPTEVGQVGRVVVTTLQDLLRPLIRYEVGDFAEVSRHEEDGILLAKIVGRERTMIVTKQGTRVWPYFELGELAERGIVKQWQLVQHKDHSLTIRVDAARPLEEDDRRAIRRSIDALSDGLPLSIEEVETIERTARGKFREVISELDLEES